MLEETVTWDRHMDERLREMWGTMPRSQIAAELGVDPDAVRRRERRLELTSPTNTDQYLSSHDISEIFGLNMERAYELSARMPTQPIYIGDRCVHYVNRYQMMAWLADPLNLYGIDPQQITDEHVAIRVEEALSQWDDVWMSVSEAGDLLTERMAKRAPDGPHIGDRAIYRWLFEGKIPGQRFGRWYVRRTYVTTAVGLIRRGALYDTIKAYPEESYGVCPRCCGRYERLERHIKACVLIPIDVAHEFRSDPDLTVQGLARRYSTTPSSIRRAMLLYGVTPLEIKRRKRDRQRRTTQGQSYANQAREQEGVEEEDSGGMNNKSLRDLYGWRLCSKCEIAIFRDEQELAEAQKYVDTIFQPNMHLSPDGRYCPMCLRGD